MNLDDRQGYVVASVGLCGICGGLTHRLDNEYPWMMLPVNTVFERDCRLCYKCKPKMFEHHAFAFMEGHKDGDPWTVSLGHDDCKICGTMSRANR